MTPAPGALTTISAGSAWRQYPFCPADISRLSSPMPPVLVSIVTPVYNQCEYLAATMESVLAQDYPNLEYLVIDDGSTDGSLELARRYEASHPGRLKVLGQANAGQAATLNRGWTLCQGELIGYLSSDDTLEPGAITALVAALAERSDCSVSYGDFRLMDGAGHCFRDVQAEEFDARRLTVDLVCQPGPGALMRRSVFALEGGWNAGLRQVPDFEFWLRASRHGPFVRVPQLLARYRVHGGSASLRPVSAERCDEISTVMDRYWQGDGGATARASRARARVLAARLHAQSGRFGTALANMWRACRFSPSRALHPGAWRMVLAGALRRTAYTLSGLRS